jgi:hypothetical protein
MPAPFDGRRIDSSISPFGHHASNGGIQMKKVNAMGLLRLLGHHAINLASLAISSQGCDGSRTVSYGAL